jgi:flagellum-specific peptidoglycan hydrolase FlgJ
MDELYVAPVKTLCTDHDIITAITIACRGLFGSEPCQSTVAILAAQVEFECGHGKELWNWNLGNIKRTKGHKYTMYKCNEILKGVVTYFSPPHPQTHFNSYESLPEAAGEHLAFLNGSRYQAALQCAKDGNPEEYCAELKKAGYYTDTLEHYTKTLVSIYNGIMKDFADEEVNEIYGK